MKIKYVEAFLVLYSEKNISKASEKMFITQQGLSRQLHKLEESVNGKLFERKQNGVEPTAFANEIYPYMKQLYETYEQILDIAKVKGAVNRPKIKIGMAYGLANAIPMDFVFAYQERNSQIEIELQEYPKQMCINKLLKKEIDLAFLVNPFDMSKMNAVPIAEGEMYVAMHKQHPLAERENLCIKDLNHEKMVTGPEHNCLRQLFDYLCEKENVYPFITMTTSQSVNYINSMKKNQGLVTVTGEMCKKITNPQIVIKRLLASEAGYFFCCVGKNAQPKKEVIKLQDYIVDIFKDMKRAEGK